MSFRESVCDVVLGDHKYFSDSNGRKLTFDDIESDNSLLLGDSVPYEGKSREEIREDLAFIDKFDLWLNFGIPYHYDRFKRNGITIEESTFLFGFTDYSETELYDRAIRDHTLNQLSVQRRIALNVFLYYDTIFNIGNNIDNLLGYLNHKLKQRSELVRKMESSGFKLSMIYGPAKQRSEEVKYKIRAVMGNRKWLERVLTR